MDQCLAHPVFSDEHKSHYIGGFLIHGKTVIVMPTFGSLLLYIEELEDAILLLCSFV